MTYKAKLTRPNGRSCVLKIRGYSPQPGEEIVVELSQNARQKTRKVRVVAFRGTTPDGWGLYDIEQLRGPDAAFGKRRPGRPRKRAPETPPDLVELHEWHLPDQETLRAVLAVAIERERQERRRKW